MSRLYEQANEFICRGVAAIIAGAIIASVIVVPYGLLFFVLPTGAQT